MFFVPEIADYELRRELVRHGNVTAIARLETFNAGVSGTYLHGDALIAAQADLLDPAVFGLSGMVVATANAGHLSVMTNAVLWSDIGF